MTKMQLNRNWICDWLNGYLQSPSLWFLSSMSANMNERTAQRYMLALAKEQSSFIMMKQQMIHFLGDGMIRQGVVNFDPKAKVGR